MEAELKDSIDKLRAELAELDDGDLATRERVQSLIAKVEQKLDAEQDDDDESLLEHIREGIDEFETSHPRITAIIDNLATTLSNMGI